MSTTVGSFFCTHDLELRVKFRGHLKVKAITKIVNDSGVIFLYSWPWTSGKVSRSFQGQGHNENCQRQWREIFLYSWPWLSDKFYQVYKYETGNDIYVSLGKTIRSVKPNHWRHFFALSSVNNIQFINNQVSYNS